MGVPPSMHQGTSNGGKPIYGVSGALDNETSHLASETQLHVERGSQQQSPTTLKRLKTNNNQP